LEREVIQKTERIPTPNVDASLFFVSVIHRIAANTDVFFVILTATSALNPAVVPKSTNVS
jgi:hypothetical protein